MNEEIEVWAEATPNPEAAKFTINRTLIEKGSKTFNSPEQAEDSPLAKKLFSVPGVKSVFMLGSFVTVTRQPDADWEELADALAKAIREFFASQT
jgi:hypothetical protein